MQTHSNFDSDTDEPIGESMLNPIGWLGAFALLLVVSAAQIGDADDHRGEWVQSQALKDAQVFEQRSEHRARAAQELCTADHGPQALAVWSDDNTVECINHRGRRLSTSRMEDDHAAH